MERPIYKVTIEALVWNDTLLAIDNAPLKALLQWPYFDCLIFDGFTYNGPIYKGQAKCLANVKTHQGF